MKNKWCWVVAVAGTPGVRALLFHALHAGGTPSGYRCQTRMGALDFSACPVNTAETLQRTSALAIEGIGTKKKIALLGSTVRKGQK